VIRHPFTNPKSDGADATVVRPSDWNATHGGLVGAFLTADYSCTTTLADLTNLAGFAIGANEDWAISACFMYTAASVTGQGLEIRATGPASPSNVRGVSTQPNTTATTIGRVAWTALGTGYGLVTAANALTGVEYTLRLLVENGANAGSIQFGARMKVAGTVTVLRGSHYTAVRLA
jgi:hypothetical protein